MYFQDGRSDEEGPFMKKPPVDLATDRGLGW
jgi:hypothetical protein